MKKYHYFIIVFAVLVIAAILAAFGFRSDQKEAALIGQAERFQSAIHARGDGSSFDFAVPEGGAHDGKLVDLHYYDAENQIRYDIGEVDILRVDDGKASGILHNVTINPKLSAPLFIQTTRFEDVDLFLGRAIDWQSMTFDAVDMTNVRMEGQLTAGNPVKMKMDRLLLDGLSINGLARMDIENFSLGNVNFPDAVIVSDLSRESIQRAELVQTANTIREGYLPIGILPLDAALSDNSEGLNELLNTPPAPNSVAAREEEIRNRLLNLFEDNAPKEMLDFLEELEGRDFQEKLQKFQEQSPEEQALTALELFLDGIESLDDANRGEPNQPNSPNE